MVLVEKNLSANGGNLMRCEFDPWVRKIPWRRKCQPIPTFLLREFHGQRSLVGYNSGDSKELDMTEGT